MVREAAGSEQGLNKAESVGVGTVARLKDGLVREARRFVYMFFYLWAIFALFALHESIILAEAEASYVAYGLAAVNAFVLAKVMLVAEKLNVARGFEDGPLIFPILYKSVVLAILLVVFLLVKKNVIGLVQGKTAGESLPTFGGGRPGGLASVALLMAISLLPFFAFREIDRVLGPGVLRDLFLARRSKGSILGPRERS